MTAVGVASGCARAAAARGSSRSAAARRQLLGPTDRKWPIGPGDQLPLVGQKDAGDRHDQDDEAGEDAGNEMGPEDERAKCHASVRSSACKQVVILRLSLNFMRTLSATI